MLLFVKARRLYCKIYLYYLLCYNVCNLVCDYVVEAMNMVNTELMNRIKQLEQKYAENWGKSVDYTAMPLVITQELLAKILERIVDTGESILVGFEKIKNQH